MWWLLIPALAAPPVLSDFEFVDADLHVVLLAIAGAGDVNLVVDDRVRGTVTLHLRRVTWDDALAAVLAQKGLAAVPAGRDTWEVRPKVEK